jgi:hypothetical protein
MGVALLPLSQAHSREVDPTLIEWEFWKEKVLWLQHAVFHKRPFMELFVIMLNKSLLKE